MEAAIAQYTESRNQCLILQDQLVKLHNRINETLLKQKRIEAELEEIQHLPESMEVYKQVVRMFSIRTVKNLKGELRVELKSSEEDLPKLREIESETKRRLIEAQKVCVEAEEILAKKSKSGSASK